MATSYDAELEELVLQKLYNFAQKHPTAPKRLRLNNDKFAEDDVTELLDDLFAKNRLSGNVDERNVQLTSDGIEYVEQQFPAIADAAD